MVLRHIIQVSSVGASGHMCMATPTRTCAVFNLMPTRMCMFHTGTGDLSFLYRYIRHLSSIHVNTTSIFHTDIQDIYLLSMYIRQLSSTGFGSVSSPPCSSPFATTTQAYTRAPAHTSTHTHTQTRARHSNVTYLLSKLGDLHAGHLWLVP